MRFRSYVVAAALAASVFGASPAGATVPTPAGVVARYSFDQATGSFGDESGRGHTMITHAAHGGALKLVSHGAGRGLEFPVKCTAKASTCSRVVLQTPNSADLNPAARPLSFGATVRLTKGQTSKGENVVQKGYSATSSQYKLQVDGVAGRPSCVLVDQKSPVIRLVRSSVTVADGAWHALECRRAAAAFSIVVDGVTRGLTAVPAALTVTNTSPLSIGGKGAYKDNDQFQGAVDDVWVKIG
jgi:hypothetical protein